MALSQNCHVFVDERIVPLLFLLIIVSVDKFICFIWGGGGGGGGGGQCKLLLDNWYRSTKGTKRLSAKRQLVPFDKRYQEAECET